MPKYIYRAVNQKGRPIRGVITAANESDLGTRLGEGGLSLVDCKEMSEKAGKLAAFSIKKVKIRDLTQMFLHLGQMQKAGIALLEVLADVRDTTDSAALRDVMSDVYREVTEGVTLSVALGNHPETFDQIYVSLIAAAEETGNLIGAYEQCIRHLKWTDAMQSKVKKATRYPKILVAVVLGVIWMMMHYVVPQVAGFLEASGQALPPVTAALIATSEFFGSYFLYMVFLMIFVYVAVTVARNLSEDFKYRTDYLALNLPVMGPLIRKIALSRFSQTFGVLSTSGIDILKCLDAAKLTAGNLVIVDALAQVRQRVQEGASLSDGLKASGEFPSLVLRMVRVGEETGSLSEVLEQVSEFYDKDVNDAVDAMIQMIEPTLTVALGGMIVWIAAAVFGPIYDTIGTMGL